MKFGVFVTLQPTYVFKHSGMANIKNHITVGLRDERSSGILRIVNWYFVTDVSGQPIGEESSSHSSWAAWPLKMGPIGFCRKVGYKLPIYAAQHTRIATISLTSRRKSQITQILVSVMQIVYCSGNVYRMYCAAQIFVPDRDVYSSLTLRNPHDTPLCLSSYYF